MSEHMLMASKIGVYFVLPQQWKDVHLQVVVVMIPLTEHGVMLDTHLPDNGGIVVPLLQSVFNPLVHLDTLGTSPWVFFVAKVVAGGLLDLLSLFVEIPIRTMEQAKVIVSAEGQARVNHEETHLLSVRTNL